MLRIFRIDRVFRPGNGWRAAVALMGLAVLVCASCQTTEAWQKPVDDREAAARLAALHGEGGAAVGGGGEGGGGAGGGGGWVCPGSTIALPDCGSLLVS